MNDPTNQRGSIIIYAMVTMTAMLAIGVTLSGLFVGKLRAAAAARDSTGAVYAADSAVELCLYEARQATNQPNPSFEGKPDTLSNGSTFQIINVATGDDITDDCSALGDTFQFRATGMNRGVRRTLEITQ